MAGHSSSVGAALAESWVRLVDVGRRALHWGFIPLIIWLVGFPSFPTSYCCAASF